MPHPNEALLRDARFTTLLVAIALAGCTTEPDRTVWSSNDVSLTIGESTATLRFLADGGCYGSFGELPQLPDGSFSIAGTFTQLTGVAPGSVQYSAQFTGIVSGHQMTISVFIAQQQRTLGPYTLTAGVQKNWTPCLYP